LIHSEHHRLKSIVLLRDSADGDIKKRQQEYQKLFEIMSDDGAEPTSARAMIMTTGKEVRKQQRTPHTR
jgi:hypothetical protein